MKPRKVKSAKLHNPYFTLGTGQLDKTMDSSNYTGMELAYTEYGLEVRYRGAYFVIPSAGVAGMTFFPDEPCEWISS